MHEYTSKQYAEPINYIDPMRHYQYLASPYEGQEQPCLTMHVVQQLRFFKRLIFSSRTLITIKIRIFQ